MAAAAIASAAFFLSVTLPKVPSGPVLGTGQDEWYNMVRGLRALYERLHPSYFIHPALYYEVLAFCYGAQRLVVGITSGVGVEADFLDYFLIHEWRFLELARSISVGCGALAVAAAVWLGAVLSGALAGLLAGLLVASLPLLQSLSTTIRVDAMALATVIAAATLVVRWYRRPSKRSFVLAAVGIGIAAAANYPGALLLVLLAWFEWVRPGDDLRSRRAVRIGAACVLAFGVFIVLNPYVLIDLRQFLAWFAFQAQLPVFVHPHAEEPSATRYLLIVRDQGPAALVACVLGVAAISKPRHASGALGAFALAYLLAFSVMQTQYDRFVLPAIALLCIAGASWLCVQLEARTRLGTATALVMVLAAVVVWSGTTTSRREVRWEPGGDYRAEMFEWIAQHVPTSATLVLESDTLPLLQTVYDPGGEGGPFQASLRTAFEKLHPDLVKKIVKVQFIAAVYNYDPKLLDAGEVFFLASSQNREFIAANRAVLAQPAAFYDILDSRAALVHETGGVHERLKLYSIPASASAGDVSSSSGVSHTHSNSASRERMSHTNTSVNASDGDPLCTVRAKRSV